MTNTLDKETIEKLAKEHLDCIDSAYGYIERCDYVSELQGFSQAVIEHVGGEPVAWAVFNEATNSYEFISDWRQGANEHINDMPTEMIKDMRLVPMFSAPPALETENARLKEALQRLASMEAFTVSRFVTDKDDEAMARIEYAQQAIKDNHGN